MINENSSRMQQLTDGLKGYDPSKQVSKVISCKGWEGAWPFTVEEVELCCLGDQVFIQYGGSKYALNGNARHAGIQNFTPLWKNNPGGAGKVDIGEMIAEGLRL